MTKNLTEQWKNGELTGEYWCEITESPYPERVYLPTCDSDIIAKVLSPVPSYEEWERVKKYANKCEVEYIECANDYEKLKEENAKLKELLKECKGLFNRATVDGAEPNNAELITILNKIDEVLNVAED